LVSTKLVFMLTALSPQIDPPVFWEIKNMRTESSTTPPGKATLATFTVGVAVSVGVALDVTVGVDVKDGSGVGVSVGGKGVLVGVDGSGVSVAGSGESVWVGKTVLRRLVGVEFSISEDVELASAQPANKLTTATRSSNLTICRIYISQKLRLRQKI
jgi:hypothetical protein